MSRKRQPSREIKKPEYKYEFQQEDILVQRKGKKQQLFRVIEDISTNDDKKRVRVMELKEVGKEGQKKTFEEGANETTFQVKDKIEKLKDVEVVKKRGGKKQFKFDQSILEEVSVDVKQKVKTSVEKKKPVPKALPKSSEDEDEQEEEVEEQDEQPKGRSKKTVKIEEKQPARRGRKQVEVEVAVEEDDEEEEEVEVVKTQNKKRPVKKQKQQKSIPKRTRTSSRPGRKPAKQEYDEESNKNEEEDEEEQQVAKKSSKKATKSLGPNKKKPVGKKESKQEAQSQSESQWTENEDKDDEEVQQSQNDEAVGSKKKSNHCILQIIMKESKTKSETKSSKFKKGKFNPLVKVIDVCKQLEDKSNKLVNNCCVKCNNKELLRASLQSNQRLFEEVMNSQYQVSNFFERWAPENDFNAVEILFKNCDKRLLAIFLNKFNNMHKLKLANPPACSLKEADTGFNDKYAYGVRTRRVQISRGGREGNNAFVYDLSTEENWGQFMIQRLLEIDTDPSLFNLIQAQLPNYFNQFETLVPLAVRCGNYKVAGSIIKSLVKKGNFYGYNQLHADVLNLTDPSKIPDNLKKPSVTKRNVGTLILTPIHCAAINPNPEFLQKLLEIAPEYSIMDEIMRKPVHYAATCQGSGPLKYLLSKGVDPREGDREKSTPLILAARYGRHENIKILIDHLGADIAINFKNREGNSALHLAAQNGHLECVKLLIDKGANIHLPGRNRATPLILASAMGHFHIVQYLLENTTPQAKILAKDKFKRSALIMAVRNGNLKIVSYLLAKGAEYNGADSSNNSAVHYAAAYGFSECIEVLVKAGADQNAVNTWKLTPLSVALQKGHFGVVKTLLNFASTDVNCKDDEGRTLVSSAISKLSEESYEQIRFLIEDKGADVKIQDLKGRSALYYAAMLQPTDVWSKHKNWEEKSIAERNELTESFKKLIFKVIDLLISKGADPNEQDENGSTPFTNALISKNFCTVSKILQVSRPKYELIDKEDKNIIHQMSKNGIALDEEGVELFRQILQEIENKEQFLNAYDSQGFTPILYYMHQYFSSARSVYQNIFNKKLNNKFQEEYEIKRDKELQEKKKQPKKKVTRRKGKKAIEEDEEEQEIQEEQEEQLEEEEVMVQIQNDDENSIDDEEDEEEEDANNRPIKRQKKIASKAPAFSLQSQGMVGGFGFSQFGSKTLQTQTGHLKPELSKTFYFKGTTPIIVTITQEEYDGIIKFIFQQ